MKQESNWRNIMNKKFLSTYERIAQDPSRKKRIDKEYQELLLSELIIALMEEDHVSVRKLAETAGLSPSIIQDIRSGKKDNLTLRSFENIISALGYSIVLEKSQGNRRPSKKLHLPGLRKNRIKYPHDCCS